MLLAESTRLLFFVGFIFFLKEYILKSEKEVSAPKMRESPPDEGNPQLDRINDSYE
jgi:uncharacterized membrane protein AbrB (regulator of aidB expression)